MNKRDFLKQSLLFGSGVAISGCVSGSSSEKDLLNLPQQTFDVIVAGAGTAGVIAAIAAARTGAKTALIEWKGYTGGTVTEGGTALHSYFNTWKAFPGVEPRQLVKGIPQEIIDRLMKIGGSAGHVEMLEHYKYDSVCTSVDVELYKLVSMEMLSEAGVHLMLNTMLTDAITEGSRVKGVIVESHSGREVLFANAFIDSTAYGDLSARAGATFTEPNDYPVCNSMGVGNVNMDKFYKFLKDTNAIRELAIGDYEGRKNQIVRIGAEDPRLPEPVYKALRELSANTITTTVHKNYFMFIKCGYKLEKTATEKDVVSNAELIIRKNQVKLLNVFKQHLPGFEEAFIARTSPSLNVRRVRCIECDYDVTIDDVTKGVHFPDDVFVYGFHDMAPRFQIKDGGSYGFPYRACCVKGLDNLYALGMMVTSDFNAHMSTRNTVCCMGQGQAFGTAAALCSKNGQTTRQLPYSELRAQLEKDGVYFES